MLFGSWTWSNTEKLPFGCQGAVTQLQVTWPVLAHKVTSCPVASTQVALRSPRDSGVQGDPQALHWLLLFAGLFLPVLSKPGTCGTHTEPVCISTGLHLPVQNPICNRPVQVLLLNQMSTVSSFELQGQNAIPRCEMQPQCSREGHTAPGVQPQKPGSSSSFAHPLPVTYSLLSRFACAASTKPI